MRELVEVPAIVATLIGAAPVSDTNWSPSTLTIQVQFPGNCWLVLLNTE
jgi:hypothetical protein